MAHPVVKIERDLSNSIHNISISGVKPDWITLYIVAVFQYPIMGIVLSRILPRGPERLEE